MSGRLTSCKRGVRAFLSLVLSATMVVGGVPALAVEEVAVEGDEVVPTLREEVVGEEDLDAEPIEVDGLPVDGKGIEEEALVEENALAADSDAVTEEPLAEEAAIEAEDESQDAKVESAEQLFLSPQSTATSGTIGTCMWNIDSNGCLTIKPENGKTGKLPDYSEIDESYTTEYSSSGDGVVVNGGSSALGNYWPWAHNESVKSVKIEGRVICAPNSMWLFGDLYNAITMDLDGLDTSQVTSMNRMFVGCGNLKSLDLSGFNTSNVTDMTYMFWLSYGNASIESLDVSSFDMSNVSSAGIMYYSCSNLKKWTVGAGCRTKCGDEILVPVASSSNGKWWSFAAQKWFTPDQIASSRSGIADTYTSTPTYNLSKASISVAKGFSYTYNGAARKPEPTVKLGSTILKAGTHYVVSYKNNVNAGTATVTVTGKGAHKGAKSATFTIKPVSIAEAKIASIKNKAYTGKLLKPAPKVVLGGKTLKKGTDYTLSYKKNRKVGVATVIVTGKGNYEGVAKKTFKIIPKATSIKGLTAKKKSFSVKWAKRSAQTTGYQVQYATNASFTKGKKTVKVTKASIVSRKVSGLKAKKKYYVRVRTYHVVGGKTYYSAWSAKKAVITK